MDYFPALSIKYSTSAKIGAPIHWSWIIANSMHRQNVSLWTSSNISEMYPGVCTYHLQHKFQATPGTNPFGLAERRKLLQLIPYVFRLTLECSWIWACVCAYMPNTWFSRNSPTGVRKTSMEQDIPYSVSVDTALRVCLCIKYLENHQLN